MILPPSKQIFDKTSKILRNNFFSSYKTWGEAVRQATTEPLSATLLLGVMSIYSALMVPFSLFICMVHIIGRTGTLLGEIGNEDELEIDQSGFEPSVIRWDFILKEKEIEWSYQGNRSNSRNFLC